MNVLESCITTPALGNNCRAFRAANDRLGANVNQSRSSLIAGRETSKTGRDVGVSSQARAKLALADPLCEVWESAIAHLALRTAQMSTPIIKPDNNSGNSSIMTHSTNHTNNRTYFCIRLFASISQT